MLLKPDGTNPADRQNRNAAQEKDSNLPAGMTPKINWKLKGVALLCFKE